MTKTVVLKVDPKRPDKRSIERAADVLRSGGLVAFPTETVYGLGASFLDEEAIGRLRRVKRRPGGKPFTVHIEKTAAIKKLKCGITRQAKRLIDKYWPGPLTIVLEGKNGPKTGFRMPDNAVALALIKKAGVPVVAPSANMSGLKPPTRPEDVLSQLDGMIDILLDAGPTDVGVESTVIDLTVTPPKILREGAIKKRELLEVISEIGIL
ncbi:MAG: L-threonylcarbamoyladenylate synthase [Candidatus Omnitrophica bacterium]|nr:L-threonylcarbamoyladenylate synthase [Candidatus Omnitrophota bacterium]MDD5436203.1 L-threonylcarbamoyladenylate synthase [Candidatus Omnitrophota bacterium]